jgi:hypothetical protein
MARTDRVSMTAALIVCLVAAPWNGALFASDGQGSSSEAPSAQAQTMSTSEKPMSPVREFAPAMSVDAARTAATDVSSVSPTFTSRSPFEFRNDLFAANFPVAVQERTPDFMSAPSAAFAGQVYRGQPRPIRSGRDGSIAAIVIGAVASITGAAILVYANRPECDSHRLATGCGYGTKVVGGAVLAGGTVGLVLGALTWR